MTTIFFIILGLILLFNVFLAGIEYADNNFKSTYDYAVFFAMIFLGSLFYIIGALIKLKLFQKISVTISYTDFARWYRWNILGRDKNKEEVDFERWNEIYNIATSEPVEKRTWRQRQAIKYINFIFSKHNYTPHPSND